MKKLLVFLALLAVIAAIAHQFLAGQPLTGGYSALDRAVHWVKVNDELDVDFAKLSPDLGEERLIAAYPSAQWYCHAEPSTMGDRSCSAYVRRFNGQPAWYVGAFFRGGKLDQFLAKMPPDGYRMQVDASRQRYSVNFRPDLRGRDGRLLTWELPHGLLTMQNEPDADNVTPVLWISKAKIVRGFSPEGR